MHRRWHHSARGHRKVEGRGSRVEGGERGSRVEGGRAGVGAENHRNQTRGGLLTHWALRGRRGVPGLDPRRSTLESRTSALDLPMASRGWPRSGEVLSHFFRRCLAHAPTAPTKAPRALHARGAFGARGHPHLLAKNPPWIGAIVAGPSGRPREHVRAVGARAEGSSRIIFSSVPLLCISIPLVPPSSCHSFSPPIFGVSSQSLLFLHCFSLVFLVLLSFFGRGSLCSQSFLCCCVALSPSIFIFGPEHRRGIKGGFDRSMPRVSRPPLVPRPADRRPSLVILPCLEPSFLCVSASLLPPDTNPYESLPGGPPALVGKSPKGFSAGPSPLLWTLPLGPDRFRSLGNLFHGISRPCVNSAAQISLMVRVAVVK